MAHSSTTGMYGIVNAAGDVAVMKEINHMPVTLLDADVTDIATGRPVREDRAGGIVISRANAIKLGLHIKDDKPTGEMPYGQAVRHQDPDSRSSTMDPPTVSQGAPPQGPQPDPVPPNPQPVPQPNPNVGTPPKPNPPRKPPVDF